MRTVEILPEERKEEPEVNTEKTTVKYLEEEKFWGYLRKFQKEYAVSLEKLKDA